MKPKYEPFFYLRQLALGFRRSVDCLDVGDSGEYIKLYISERLAKETWPGEDLSELSLFIGMEIVIVDDDQGFDFKAVFKGSAYEEEGYGLMFPQPVKE